MRRFSLGLIVALLLWSSLDATAALPKVHLRSVDGRTVNASTLAGNGRPVIVSFFALWCKPCLKELKAIDEQYEDWVEKTGVQMIAVSTDDARSVDKVSTMVRAAGYEWITLLDENGDLKRAMGVNQIPHLFLLNSKGEVVWQHTSYSEGSENEIFKELLKLTQK